MRYGLDLGPLSQIYFPYNQIHDDNQIHDEQSLHYNQIHFDWFISQDGFGIPDEQYIHFMV